MNQEHVEAELLSLKGKPVIVTIPLGKRASMSLAGPLEVVQNREFACGFHIANPFGGWAVIFFPADVKSLDPSGNKEFARVINLKKDSETV